MKTLSVLFTFALLAAANTLAARLKHANALPADSVPKMTAAQTHSRAFENTRPH